ncbi:MAG TPA: L,D-transpeptidase family protein [Steroidobacter sp.]|uniref:L,D-transpeptidase family protein n=1 Tax=Steroidobacter sp. TaxID=1978227 RepID=UPI002ED90AA7
MQPPPVALLLALTWFCAAVLGLYPCGAVSQSAPRERDPMSLAIETELEKLAHADATSIQGAPIALREPLQKLYAQRNFRAAWSHAANAEQLRRALADSYEDGLDPADYHLPLIEKLARQSNAEDSTPELRAQYDILLSEALLRLSYHLSFGKVDPETFDSQWNYGRTLASNDVAQKIERALASAEVYRLVAALKPTHPLYVNLKRELARIRAATANGGPSPIPTGASVEPGGTDTRVPSIRKRLTVSGDLSVTDASDATEYDAPLVTAVRKFQQRMGLEADGVLGPGTIAELNVSPAARIQQLRVNLDRGRVLLRDLPDAFIVVNIAGFTVYFVRGERIVWNARVQVGKPYRRTPIFRSEITQLVLNPTWTVPPGIIAGDILPAAQRDPDAIVRKGLKVLDANGRAVDPHSIDWTQFKGGHLPYTLRQDPGPSNALGRAKLIFPNPYLVYLHDTPSQALFDRNERTFSSGCVRVERVLELAELVLADPAHWNQTSIARALETGETRNLTLDKKIPVLLTYWTAWVDPQGQINFRRDVYGQDAKWAQALDAGFKLRSRPLFSPSDDRTETTTQR